MKKIIASALGLMLGGTLLATTAQADVENQFGGYWRTRLAIGDNMGKAPGETTFHVNTRSRIYYTAKFNDNLKFVNKFEMNAVWGDSGYGDIGTDGMGVFRIKNTYVDATFGSVNTKVGAQGLVIHRGVLFDDDMAGVVASANFGAVTPIALWFRAMDDDWGGQDQDLDYFHVAAKIKAGDMVTINPGITFANGSTESVATTEDLVTGIGEPLETTTTATSAVGGESLIWIGLDVDVKLDPVKLYGTFMYQTGDVNDIDSAAFATVIGADAGFVHGAFLYATGDDGSDPTENTAYTPPSPYVVTAEIMGAGSTIDGTFGPQSLGWGFTNIMMANVGTTLKPADKVSVSVDGWYGALAEDNAAGNTEIGFEIDGKVTFRVLEKLRIDVFAAYLIAGDATNDAAGNTDDVMEGGARLSLSF